MLDKITLSENTCEFAKKVRNAIENDELTVYYQPQYNYDTGEMSGAEALMRWTDKNGETLVPSEFIPKMEACGVIRDADRVIWKKVCRDLCEWQKARLNVPHLSVNISGDDIYCEDFEDYIVSLVAEHGLKPEDLHLEITETAYVSDLGKMAEIIRSLRSKGFVVEMDDFGSGYSSLKCLKNVPFDIIKLDMDFLQESETNEKAKCILTSIIELLQTIKTPVIVEGVEKQCQAELLNRLGCSYMQGYYFGKPAEKSEFESLLKSLSE